MPSKLAECLRGFAVTRLERERMLETRDGPGRIAPQEQRTSLQKP